jgi:hypothetical protein
MDGAQRGWISLVGKWMVSHPFHDEAVKWMGHAGLLVMEDSLPGPQRRGTGGTRMVGIPPISR